MNVELCGKVPLVFNERWCGVCGAVRGGLTGVICGVWCGACGTVKEVSREVFMWLPLFKPLFQLIVIQPLLSWGLLWGNQFCSIFQFFACIVSLHNWIGCMQDVFESSTHEIIKNMRSLPIWLLENYENSRRSDHVPFHSTSKCPNPFPKMFHLYENQTHKTHGLWQRP